jgi:Peptidase_C39 like family
MISTIAALSLASSIAITTLDVPYLPQSDALCGGAAAAMVFRYWGDTHAGVQDFEPLVDRRAGGIADATLVSAIERRGWIVDRFDGSIARLDEHLANREPLIVLLADRGSRYHYVVVVGHRAGRVIVHDPSWGPSREIGDADFVKRWAPSNFWSLVVRPGGESGLKADTTTPSAAFSIVSGVAGASEDRCGVLLDRAIADVAQRGLSAADEILDTVRHSCPESSRPLSELAGVRFAERRWHDAAALAREALMHDPRDAYALDVLGSSLFMQNDPAGALRAWNQVGKPTLDHVRIAGLHHSRYQAITEATHLTPGALLTADAFERARRRLDELPDRVTARLDIRPDADGSATVDIVIAERASIPRSVMDWSGVGLAAVVDREVTATLPGFTGQGEVWTAGWRFWTNRPRVDLGLAVPGFAGLSGIWRVDASWDAQTYAFANSSELLRESRTHAGVSIGDWLSAGWRYSLSGGVDEWSGGRRAASLGASIERRLARDRVSIVGQGETWLTHGSVPAFNSVTIRGGWTSSLVAAGWSYAAAGGWQHVSDQAPLGLWPGAGDGHARAELLRAHPMLDDGIVNVTSASIFGRTLTFGNAEAQRWFDRTWPARLGVAVFGDVARASRTAQAQDPPLQIDVGGGLRVRVPGVKRVLRVDVAHGVRDGANALTIGWVF